MSWIKPGGGGSATPEQMLDRIAELEAAMREIEGYARAANIDDGDGGDHLLTLIESTVRNALQNSITAT